MKDGTNPKRDQAIADFEASFGAEATAVAVGAIDSFNAIFDAYPPVPCEVTLDEDPSPVCPCEGCDQSRKNQIQRQQLYKVFTEKPGPAS